MTSMQLEIQIIASIVAIACAIPGVFLVLRRMALISDAISHSILFGIVIGFFITQDLSSPLLILFASLTGVLTVVMVEIIQKSKLVKEDTAIGLVFPLLFSIGVILIARNANDVHLDIDAVLLGELAFAPFERVVIGGADCGPKALWVMGTILLLIVGLLLLFYKELKLSTFDAGLAASLGFSPVVIHYGLMTVSSVTIVGSFDAVGAILVVALMIAPAATAYLLTDNLKKMLIFSIIFGVISAIAGYWLAHFLDASIAGSMTTILGIIFLSVYLFSPRKGLFALLYKEKHQREEVYLITLLLHINNHMDSEEERSIKYIRTEINWKDIHCRKVIEEARQNNLVKIDNEILTLSSEGLNFIESALDFILHNRDDKIKHLKKDYLLFKD